MPLTDPLHPLCSIGTANASVEIRIFVRRVGHGPGGRRFPVSDPGGTRPGGGGGTPKGWHPSSAAVLATPGLAASSPCCGVTCAKVRAEAWHAARTWPPRTSDGGHDAPSRSPAPAALWPLPPSCRTRAPGCPWSCGDRPGHRPAHGSGGNASEPPAPPLRSPPHSLRQALCGGAHRSAALRHLCDPVRRHTGVPGRAVRHGRDHANGSVSDAEARQETRVACRSIRRTRQRPIALGG